MPDTYTDAEICGFYRDGKNDPYIIRKISQLALKPENEIITILHAAGHALDIKHAPQRRKPGKAPTISDDVWRKIIADRLNGVDFAKICAVHHISLNYLKNNWRKKAKELGIPLPDHQITSGIQCIPDKIRKEVEQMEEKKTEMEKLMPLPLDEKRTPSGIIRNFTYFMEPYDDAPYKAEYVDGAVELHAVIPVKEAAV